MGRTRCDLCDDEDAILHCKDCQYNFCTLCSKAVHQDVYRQEHATTPIAGAAHTPKRSPKAPQLAFGTPDLQSIETPEASAVELEVRKHVPNGQDQSNVVLQPQVRKTASPILAHRVSPAEARDKPARPDDTAEGSTKPPHCPTAGHEMVRSVGSYTCNSCQKNFSTEDLPNVSPSRWSCALCGDDFCLECTPGSQRPSLSPIPVMRCGLGVRLCQNNVGKLTVDAVLPGGAAEQDGRLLPGDEILSINDQLISDLNKTDDVAQSLVDLEGSTANLVVLRPSAGIPPFHVELVRKMFDDQFDSIHSGPDEHSLTPESAMAAMAAICMMATFTKQQGLSQFSHDAHDTKSSNPEENTIRDRPSNSLLPVIPEGEADSPDSQEATVRANRHSLEGIDISGMKTLSDRTPPVDEQPLPVASDSSQNSTILLQERLEKAIKRMSQLPDQSPKLPSMHSDAPSETFSAKCDTAESLNDTEAFVVSVSGPPAPVTPEGSPGSHGAHIVCHLCQRTFVHKIESVDINTDEAKCCGECILVVSDLEKRDRHSCAEQDSLLHIKVARDGPATPMGREDSETPSLKELVNLLTLDPYIENNGANLLGIATFPDSPSLICGNGGLLPGVDDPKPGQAHNENTGLNLMDSHLPGASMNTPLSPAEFQPMLSVMDSKTSPSGVTIEVPDGENNNVDITPFSYTHPRKSPQNAAPSPKITHPSQNLSAGSSESTTAPYDPERVLRKGWLSKEAASGIKSMFVKSQKRWCVLKSGSFQYFHSQTEDGRAEVINLGSVESVSIETKRNIPFLVLKTPARTFMFTSPDKAASFEVFDWQKEILDAIDQIMTLPKQDYQPTTLPSHMPGAEVFRADSSQSSLPGMYGAKYSQSAKAQWPAHTLPYSSLSPPYGQAPQAAIQHESMRMQGAWPGLPPLSYPKPMPEALYSKPNDQHVLLYESAPTQHAASHNAASAHGMNSSYNLYATDMQRTQPDNRQGQFQAPIPPVLLPDVQTAGGPSVADYELYSSMYEHDAFASRTGILISEDMSPSMAAMKSPERPPPM